MQTIDFHSKAKVVGFNQTKKQIKSGNAEMVFIANDVDETFAMQVIGICNDYNVTYDRSLSTEELGKSCEIDVNCAVCAFLKNV